MGTSGCLRYRSSLLHCDLLQLKARKIDRPFIDRQVEALACLVRINAWARGDECGWLAGLRQRCVGSGGGAEVQRFQHHRRPVHSLVDVVCCLVPELYFFWVKIKNSHGAAITRTLKANDLTLVPD